MYIYFWIRIEFYKNEFTFALNFRISNRLEILIFSTSITCFILRWQPLLTICIDQMTIFSSYNIFRIHSTQALQFSHFSSTIFFSFSYQIHVEKKNICECVECITESCCMAMYALLFGKIDRTTENRHKNANSQQQRFFLLYRWNRFNHWTDSICFYFSLWIWIRLHVQSNSRRMHRWA